MSGLGLDGDALDLGGGRRRLPDPWRALALDLARRIEVGTLHLTLPDGSRHTIAGARQAEHRAALHLHRARALRRLLFGGVTGFAEAYVDRDWDTPDLPGLLALALANEAALGGRLAGIAPLRLVDRLRHGARANTRRGSRRNIARHYDLGNAFYAAWLDPSLTYSSALYERADQDLAGAQDAKYRRLAGALGLRPGMRVLEIGCGWGGFAEIAARDYGCAVTALTISRAQWAHAARRIQAAGLGERASIELRDYRDAQGSYDRIVSIEMVEAVGESRWPAYFAAVRDRLRPGGAAGIQVITIDDARFARYRARPDFIQRHIFPGGMLPSPSAFARAATQAGLRIDDAFAFGGSYARTLAAWRQRFGDAWPSIAAQGFDARFRRLWEFYLAYCEAGFRAGSIDVFQYRLGRTGG